MNPILMNLPLPIITPRLILRSPKIGDGEIVNAAVVESIDILRKFMPWAEKTPNIDDSEVFVREATANWILKKCEEPWLPLFIFDKNTNEFLGATGFHNIDWSVPCLETGYWLRQSKMNHGFMTEAVNAVTQYAFRQLNVTRVAITCDINNIRSKKVPERLGFLLEATIKANRKAPLTNILSDTLLYARYDLISLPSLTVEW